MYGLDPEVDCVIVTVKAIKKLLKKSNFNPKGEKMEIYESHNQTKEELAHFLHDIQLKIIEKSANGLVILFVYNISHGVMR